MNFRQALPPETWDKLTDGRVKRFFKAGAPLMHQGDPPNFVILLEEGTVKITDNTNAGVSFPLALRGAGEILGELGPLSNRPRSATVRAVTACVSYSIPAVDFLRLTNRHELHQVIHRINADRMHQGEQRRVSQVCHAPHLRLGHLFAQLAAQVGVPGAEGTTIHLGMDRDELGLMAGIGRDTTFKALRRLKDTGFVKPETKQITIINTEELDRYLISPFDVT